MLDLAMVFRVIFVVGIVAIPILYWLSARHVDRDRARNEGEQDKRSEDRSLSRSS